MTSSRISHEASVLSVQLLSKEIGYYVTCVAIEHRQEALGVGGITGLDDDIEDQPALPVVRLSLCPY